MSATHDNAGIAVWRFNLAAEVHSYAEAKEFLGDKTLRDIGPHMVVINATNHIGVVLYETEIIRFYPDATFSVDNGGYRTPTTIARLNRFLPAGYRARHHKKLLTVNDVHGCTHAKRFAVTA